MQVHERRGLIAGVYCISRTFQCMAVDNSVYVKQTNSAQSWWPLFCAISNAVNPDEFSQLMRSVARLRSSSFSDSGLLWVAHRCRAVLPSIVLRLNSPLHTRHNLQTVQQSFHPPPQTTDEITHLTSSFIPVVWTSHPSAASQLPVCSWLLFNPLHLHTYQSKDVPPHFSKKTQLE